MIKYVRKRDLQGNEYYQESIICNKCKNIIITNPKNIYYTIKITSSTKSKSKKLHICNDCYKKAINILNDSNEKTTHSIASGSYSIKPYEERTTEELKRIRTSHMCSIESANEIDKILKDRGVKFIFMI